MRRLSNVPARFVWAQLITVVLWYLMTVVEWSQNPKNSPGLMIPMIVRGTEAFSILLVTGVLIWILQNIKGNIRKAWVRIILLAVLYPASMLANLLSLGFRSLLGYSPPPLDQFFYFHSFHFYLPMLLVLVVYAIVRNQIEINEERENRLSAENLAQQARWMMLRYQVNPHFLFNALNSVRALIGEDDENARRIVTELSDYFRYSLTRETETLVSLEQEINTVRSYCEIQKIRFQTRLNVDMDLDPEAFDCAVPVFSVQTLVENGLKYGLKTSTGIVHLEIKSLIRDGKLYIHVSNSGKLVTADQAGDWQESSGTGLENLKERLAYLDPGSRFSLYEEGEKVIAQLILTKKPLIHETMEGTDH